MQAAILILTLIAVAQATLPLARARAAERPLLRALGAHDSLPTWTAATEGLLVGAVAGVVGIAIASLATHSSNVVLVALWPVAAAATGAVAAATAAR
jgi:hypothetical protein